MNKEQFFTYHANAGGKLLTCYISGLVYNINRREFNKLPRGTKLELPCGTLYTITD
jgi:hypothetical protein